MKCGDVFVYVYSGEYGLYWRENSAGYTEDKRKAGMYYYDDVKYLLGESYKDKMIDLIPASPEFEI